MQEAEQARTGEEEFIERECLLFEAGEYPDKGVAITRDDLQAIVANSAEAIPIRIEHLAQSPFDGALGTMTRLRVVGTQLWGTLRQPIEAWWLARKAGAQALSVALDMGERRLLETSFVCCPRVASARVFCETNVVHFTTVGLFEAEKGDRETMTSVRQFAEGLIAHLRGVLGNDEDQASETARFAAEREQIAQERARLRSERVDRQILEWKRQGRMRTTERAEQIARALLTTGEGAIVRFGEEDLPISALFAQFVEANGPVVPLGEQMPADRLAGQPGGSAAAEKLIALTREKASREGLSYVQSFAAVTAAYPDLAQAAREA